MKRDTIVKIQANSKRETFAKCLISFKFKEDEKFNHRNTLSISMIKFWVWRRNWAKGGVLQRSQSASPRTSKNV